MCVLFYAGSDRATPLFCRLCRWAARGLGEPASGCLLRVCRNPNAEGLLWLPLPVDPVESSGGRCRVDTVGPDADAEPASPAPDSDFCSSAESSLLLGACRPGPVPSEYTSWLLASSSRMLEVSCSSSAFGGCLVSLCPASGDGNMFGALAIFDPVLGLPVDPSRDARWWLLRPIPAACCRLACDCFKCLSSPCRNFTYYLSCLWAPKDSSRPCLSCAASSCSRAARLLASAAAASS